MVHFDSYFLKQSKKSHFRKNIDARSILHTRIGFKRKTIAKTIIVRRMTKVQKTQKDHDVVKKLFSATVLLIQGLSESSFCLVEQWDLGLLSTRGNIQRRCNGNPLHRLTGLNIVQPTARPSMTYASPLCGCVSTSRATPYPNGN